jgi:hypothetical protein
MDVAVNLSGPVFDQRFEQAVGEFLDAARTDVAEVGYGMMVGASNVFRYEAAPPTYRWLRGLTLSQEGAQVVVSDPVVYNHWLEGVGSRNATSRFKGYRIWRLTTQQLQSDAHLIAERTLQRFIGRLS